MVQLLRNIAQLCDWQNTPFYQQKTPNVEAACPPMYAFETTFSTLTGLACISKHCGDSATH